MIEWMCGRSELRVRTHRMDRLVRWWGQVTRGTLFGVSNPNSPSEFYSKLRPGEPASPATEGAITGAERTLGVTLPEALKVFLRVRNGGPLRLNQFKLRTRPPEQSFARENYHVPSLPGVGGSSEDDLVDLTTLAVDEWGLAEGLVPLFGEGHWWCCLDYRTTGPNAEPSITHCEPAETSDNEPLEISIAASFAEFVAGLSRDPEKLEPALIALDDGAPLGEQLEATLCGLGYEKWSPPGRSQRRPPPAWEHQKYSSFVKGCRARIELWPNRLYDVSQPLTDQRPEKHPMLRVFVSERDEEACVGELLAALGRGAVLLHGLE